MRSTALSLSALIASLILLISGNAFLTTLLGVRLSIEEFDTATIGRILVFYSVGFVAGTVYTGPIIQRVGHIRAFAALAAILAAAVLVHPIAVETSLWGFLRALAGFVMAGLMVVIESWFSSKADNSNRASLFAIYQIVFFLSTAGGQILIRVGDPASFIPFSLAAILVILAVVPLSLTRRESPTITASERMSLRKLYRTSPVGTLGALVAGLLISAFYTMGPVYAANIGLDLNQISNFMASAIIAAMILAWPVGRACDHFDRYKVILVACVVAGLCSIVAAAIGSFNMLLLVLFVGLYMGISATLYPIAVAITNDLMDSHQITQASTALLLSYGTGSIAGPLISSFFMQLLGPRGLFVSNAVILTGLTVFIVIGARRAHPSVSQQEHFYTTTPEATLGLHELDPRNPDFEAEADQDRRSGEERRSAPREAASDDDMESKD